MAPRYARQPSLQVESIGSAWVAFSAASGETVLLNDESAAILEVLQDAPRTSREVAESLAPDVGMDVDELAATIDGGWLPMIDAGLVRIILPTDPDAFGGG